MTKKCVICGEPSGMYPLCKKHMEMKNNGEVIKNEKGQWIIKQTENDESSEVDITKENTCIICGKESNGYHLCKSCYAKYKNKKILIRITNSTKSELLDEEYDGNCRCKDGHIVKSKEEARIDDYLFDKEIKHAYEPSYSIDAEHIIHPDFLLPNYIRIGTDGKAEEPIDVYIEHFGIKGNKKYEEMKEWKKRIYEENNVTVICTYGDEMNQDLYGTLDRKLKFFEKNKVNFYK